MHSTLCSALLCTIRVALNCTFVRTTRGISLHSCSLSEVFFSVLLRTITNSIRGILHWCTIMGAEGASGNLLWTILLRRTGREDVGTGPDIDLETCILPPNTNTNASTNSCTNATSFTSGNTNTNGDRS